MNGLENKKLNECHFCLGNLLDLGYYMKRRIIEQSNVNYLNIIFNDKTQYYMTENILAKELIFGELFERRMKINSKIDLKIMLDQYYRNQHDILIFRNIFSARYRQLFVILYNDKCNFFSLKKLVKIFRLIVYNLITCEHFTKNYGIRYVRQFVPY